MMSAEVTHTSIEQVLSRLPGIAERAGHTELYGIDITQVSNPPVKLLAGKYLRAHNNDVDAASKAIEDTLVWRKEFQPRKAAYDEQHAPKFDGIGYNTVLGDDVVVWNIYGMSDLPCECL